MTTTVSSILYSSKSDDPNHELLRRWCDISARSGGSFSIETRYVGEWRTTYTINWPEGMTPAAATQQGAAP